MHGNRRLAVAAFIAMRVLGARIIPVRERFSSCPGDVEATGNGRFDGPSGGARFW